MRGSLMDRKEAGQCSDACLPYQSANSSFVRLSALDMIFLWRDALSLLLALGSAWRISGPGKHEEGPHEVPLLSVINGTPRPALHALHKN